MSIRARVLFSSVVRSAAPPCRQSGSRHLDDYVEAFGKMEGPKGPSTKTQRSLTFQNVEHRLIFLFKLGKNLEE